METLTGNDDGDGLSKRLKDMRAVACDRAATNKRAIDILEEDHNISPFAAYCFSHGISNCGKKAHMTTDMEVLCKLVEYKLCKARNVFCAAFNESARRRELN